MMRRRSAAELRRLFLDYFKDRGHTEVESYPLVPRNDPTLLFTNAGMVPFKDVFTGKEKRSYARACSSQKCVRAGGKHNDLENVGRTARHQTFFEMLGNFSFGDYFKKDAIAFAWELVTQVIGIDQERLAVTVFRGEEGIPGDDEAHALWRETSGLPNERIHRLGMKDNFWAMGETGPCGPCSEIHYFQGNDVHCPVEAAGGRCAGVECDCDRWLEIWNLVFMQFERSIQPGKGATLAPLPKPSIDTGMGLERLTCVVQGVRSNYETDLLRPLVDCAAQISQKTFVPTDYEGESVSLRAIADHARASAFLIADGVFPDKTGREYVLRRIMRRAIYHGWQLGVEKPFLHEVVDRCITSMREAYPELGERRDLIVRVTLEEEKRFRETIERGVELIQKNPSWREEKGQRVMPGAVAFKLYDTYGFPLDLTELIGRKQGYSVDSAGYERAMEEQRARSTFQGSGEKAVEEVYKALAGRLGPTRTLYHEGRGVTGQGKVLALIALPEGREVESVEAGGEVAVVLDQTPFYGEQGGQIGDTGQLSAEAGTVRIEDTQRPVGDLTVHHGRVETGRLRRGDTVKAEVDAARRDAIRRNHSATHLLHWALREVLGTHVAQKGSLVAPDRLRFDFSHFAPLTAEERRRVEDLVNQVVLQNVDSRTEVLPIAQAKQRGAIAFFGEKYGERVRVVEMGPRSLEFCGGTHVFRTGDIGLFKLVGEQGIAQGVRRVEAVTGEGAATYVRRLEQELDRAAEVLKLPTGTGPSLEVAARAERLAQRERELLREVAELKQKLASGGAGQDPLSQVREVGGVKVLATRLEVADKKVLRDLGDKLRDKLGSGVVVLGGEAEGKAVLVAMVTKDLTAKIHAGKLIGEIAKEVGGRGGGRPDMAEAGGDQPDALPAALERVYALVERSQAGS